jgi:isoaspartyl peptidase/L-asparaginase-like protein (Ntn-hydrolase superfamily)
MEETPHVMMTGEGASRVADEFKLERITQEELVTEEAAQEFEEWSERSVFGDSFGHAFTTKRMVWASIRDGEMKKGIESQG